MKHIKLQISVSKTKKVTFWKNYELQLFQDYNKMRVAIIMYHSYIAIPIYNIHS